MTTLSVTAQPSRLSRFWQWLGRFAEAMDATETSILAERIDHLEREVVYLRRRVDHTRPGATLDLER